MPSTISDNMFYMTGVAIVTIFGFSLALNIFVIFIFLRILRRKRNNVTFTIINISAANIFQAGVYPLTAITAFRKEYPMKFKECEVEGFIITWFSITAIALLTCMGYERLRIVKRKLPTDSKLTAHDIFRVGGCWIYGLFWAAAPLLGWSRYSPKGIGMVCTVDWHDRSISGLSYTASLFIAAFFAPVLVTCFSYISIWRIVKKQSMTQAKEDIKENGHNSISQSNAGKSFDMALTGFLMTISFLSAWVPFTIVSLIAVINPGLAFTPALETVPYIIAKSSTVYIPLVYGVKHTAFRIECFKLLKRS